MVAQASIRLRIELQDTLIAISMCSQPHRYIVVSCEARISCEAVRLTQLYLKNCGCPEVAVAEERDYVTFSSRITILNIIMEV